MKIENDKYYTPIEIANHCIETVVKVIGKNKITDVIEPSCGNGAFFHSSVLTPNTGFDILPEIESSQGKFDIIKADFLSLAIPYKEGRLTLGNPPFGDRMSMATKFYDKATEIGDYIAYILPISQLDNPNSLYKFNLIYSEDLGTADYSGRKLHCCFNIYSRPLGNLVNKKPTNTLKDITIYRQDCKDYDKKPFDIRMCRRGNGCAGKILCSDEHYSAEYKILINNNELRDKILKILTEYDWKSEIQSIAVRSIKQYHIINVLKRYIPEIM